ncbi:MAG: putative DNA-binding domain-containing protein [Hyphomicrobiaceae bacterium]|nr:putative DNA-binding domain-containing protein [Hyphomicrobiaceae bacterium]
MMANLAALQHQMQSVILRRTATAQHGGSTTSYQVPRDDLLSQLRPPAHAQTDAMLDIYCNAYRSRLAEVLEADLANLSAYLGKALFEHAAAGYIEAHPSDRQNVRWFSRNMPDFLAATAPFSNWPQMAEVARIELALADAFDSANAETFSLAMLTSISPDDWATLMVVPHPSVRRIDALTNALDIWIAIDAGTEPPQAKRLNSPQHLIVWREATTPRIRVMSIDEATAFDAAQPASTFADVVAAMTSFEDQREAAKAAVGFLAGWAAAGMLACVDTEAANSHPKQETPA